MKYDTEIERKGEEEHIECLNGKLGCKLIKHRRFDKSSDNNKMKYGWHEVCDGLVHHHKSSFDASTIVAQFSEFNDVLKNQLR